MHASWKRLGRSGCLLCWARSCRRPFYLVGDHQGTNEERCTSYMCLLCLLADN